MNHYQQKQPLSKNTIEARIIFVINAFIATMLENLSLDPGSAASTQHNNDDQANE